MRFAVAVAANVSVTAAVRAGSTAVIVELGGSKIIKLVVVLRLRTDARWLNTHSHTHTCIKAHGVKCLRLRYFTTISNRFKPKSNDERTTTNFIWNACIVVLEFFPFLWFFCFVFDAEIIWYSNISRNWNTQNNCTRVHSTPFGRTVFLTTINYI